MARLFDDASNEYLGLGSAVLTGVPITMACFFNVNDVTSITQVFMSHGNDTVNASYFALFAADNVLKANVRETSFGEAIATGTFNINTWTHACGVFAANNDRKCYRDGGNVGSNATVITPAGINKTNIGRLVRLAPAFYVSGLMAEVAIWNIALSAAEVLILSKGYSPLFIHPQNLVAYWPLIRDITGDGTGDDIDRVGGYDMSPVNTPTIGNHPRIIYPNSPQIISIPPLVSPVGIMTPNTGYWGSI